MIDPQQLRVYVIAPVLRQLGLDSLAAQNLLLGTAAQESQLGRYVVQLGGGPARGIYQMEPATHNDVRRWLVMSKPLLATRVRGFIHPWGELHDQLVWNLAYATAMARVMYYRRPEPLPDAHDVRGLAAYWKRFWNTAAGAGTEAQFTQHYHSMLGATT